MDRASFDAYLLARDNKPLMISPAEMQSFTLDNLQDFYDAMVHVEKVEDEARRIQAALYAAQEENAKLRRLLLKEGHAAVTEADRALSILFNFAGTWLSD